MRYQMSPEAELQDAVSDGRAVIVAGTGVSIAATREPTTGRSHPHSSWAGLLKSGLAWLKEHELISSAKAQAYEVLLQDDAETHHFISVAQDVVRQMGGVESRHFADWLKRTVGTIQPHDTTVLDTLHALRAHGNVLATTNYDGLLLDSAYMVEPVTWREPDALVRVARNKEIDKILFLHGYWRRPESVILDWNSYQEIVRDERYRNELGTVWQMTTWVYVGCGINGLNDPDIGLLFERYGRRARQAELWDFCLVQSGQREEFQAHFDRSGINVRAISFGDSHDQLPAFLRSLLRGPSGLPPASTPGPRRRLERSIPKPPALYAQPDYIGSHAFVGRSSQLQDLSEWAKPADPTNLLLYDAIGGSGKSMLTWEWTTKHAPSIRSDWAGRFWYSCYQHGASMADFCRRALAYMTSTPLDDLVNLPYSELAADLLARLHAQPWLVVLDGVERLLVAYHRIDAAEMSDENADGSTDTVLSRNPCDAIREDDGDLLRAFAASAPSKILASSRLVPRVLLNFSGQPIPGAKRITLPGLRPADAELLLRACGVSGDAERMRSYLTRNCDNHPLVIGVLAGLVTNYLPDRGNFEAWVSDASPLGGGSLNLATLDLAQRRNHILLSAFAALPEKGRELLTTLALLPESVDYATVSAFNPHMPPAPEEVALPAPPESDWRWQWSSASDKQKARRTYRAALAQRNDYERALTEWRESAATKSAASKLAETVRDLEQRGLLQYDRDTRRHDLHPVVRSIALARLNADDKQRYGQRVLDHFSGLHNPYTEAKLLEDIAPGLHVVRTLLKLERFQEAADAYWGDLSYALMYNLAADAEVLALLRPFFPGSWAELPKQIDLRNAINLTHDAANALRGCDEIKLALEADKTVLRTYLAQEDWGNVSTVLCNMAQAFRREHLLVKALCASRLAIELDSARGYAQGLFISRLGLFKVQSMLGLWTQAAETWQLLDPMGRHWDRWKYGGGDAECAFAVAQFWRGMLTEQDLTEAATAAEADNNRSIVHRLHWLRGTWRLEQREFALAAASLQEDVRLDRERGLQDAEDEAALAVSKLYLGQLGDPDEIRGVVERLERITRQRKPAQRYLALLCQAIGDIPKATTHALAFYEWAWADGEPYVNRYDLTKATELLKAMDIPVPNLPAYNGRGDNSVPLEADVRAAIAKIRGEAQAKQARESGGPEGPRYT